MVWWKRDRGPERVVVYLDPTGRWRWHAVARNGKITAAAEQGYASKYYARDKATAYATAFGLPVDIDTPEIP
jgi:uncharacterized protein YegP (UPF0339 family)